MYYLLVSSLLELPCSDLFTRPNKQTLMHSSFSPVGIATDFFCSSTYLQLQLRLGFR